VLVLRLLMLAVAAIYTPQAASTIAMIVSEKERASANFLRFFSLVRCVGCGRFLPVVTFLSAHFGWRATYGVLGATAAAAFALNLVGLPGRAARCNHSRSRAGRRLRVVARSFCC